MLLSEKALDEIRTLLELVADERTNGPTANWELIDKWLLEAHRLAVVSSHAAETVIRAFLQAEGFDIEQDGPYKAKDQDGTLRTTREARLRLVSPWKPAPSPAEGGEG